MPRNAIKPFKQSLEAYEKWLAAQLRGDVRRADLDEKHDKMRKTPFVFLRATYWRWAEVILTACDDLADAPQAVAVGDIHLENFGVWRDNEGRLVWGVNDFDEAAAMSYAIDLVRLAASAILASRKHAEPKDVASAILAGYDKGLERPRPFVLDEDHMRMRALFAVSEEERAGFWTKMAELPNERGIADRYRSPIVRAMPGKDADVEKFARRSAGTGSLGRPRWVCVATWRGGRVVREAKAVVPSAWTLAHPQRGDRRAAAAGGRYRAPDPWYGMQRSVVVRRLSPNSRKIEVKEEPELRCNADMLAAMGHELANVHLGTGDAKAIRKDFDRRNRKDKWLVHDAGKAADAVRSDFDEWSR
jgi:hypothetical protein